MWSTLKNYTDAALLFLRLTLGWLFLYVYGWPKLAGGQHTWHTMGTSMQHVGVYLWPEFWGFVAACTASLGSVFFLLGFLFRPTCLLFGFILAVIAVSDYAGASVYDRVLHASHALELLFVFIALLFIGPGRFSVDKG